MALVGDPFRLAAAVERMAAAQVLQMQTGLEAQFVLFGRGILAHSHQLA
jgi:hypothetical protein